MSKNNWFCRFMGVAVLLIGLKSAVLSQPVFDSDQIVPIMFGMQSIGELLAKEEYEKVIPVARRIRKMAIEIGWGDVALNTNNVITRSHFELLHYDSVQYYIQDGFRLIKDLSVGDLGQVGLNFTTGFYYLSLSAVDSSIFYLNKIPDLLDNPTLLKFDFIPEKETAWRKSLELQSKFDFTNELNLVRGQTYNALGLAYTALSDCERADGYFQLAIDNYQKVKNVEEETNAWINRGITWLIPSIYDKKYCKVVTDHLNKALDVIQQSEKGDTNSIGIIYRQLGWTALLAEDTLGAYHYFQKAGPYILNGNGGKLAKKLLIPAELYRTAYLTEKAMLQSMVDPKENTLKSILPVEKKLDSLIQSGTIIYEDVLFSTLANMGNAYTNLKEWDKTEHYYRQGIEAYWPESNPFQTESFDATKIASSYHTSGINLILNCARLFEKKYQNTGSDEARMKCRLFYRAVADVIEQKRLDLTQNPGKSIGFGNALLNSDNYANIAYNGYIRTFPSNGTLNNEDRENILAAMEKSKAYLLSQTVKRIKEFKGMSATFKAKEKEYKEKILAAKIDLSISTRRADQVNITRHDQEVRHWQDSLDQLYATLSGDYRSPLYIPAVRTSTEIISKIVDENSAFLEFELDISGKIHVVCGTKNGITYKSIEMPKTFEKWLTDCADFVQDPESYNSAAKFENYVTGASNLYTLLIQPFEELLKDKSHLIIIPDDQIHRLNFESLLCGEVKFPEIKNHEFTEELPDYGDMPYLLKRFSIQYGHSLNLLVEQDNLGYTPEADNFLNYGGFEPTYQDYPIKNYPDFDMVGDISKIFPKPVKCWVGNNANGADFVASIAGHSFGITQFSGHSELDEFQPELSRLLFSHSDPDSANDTLTVAELYTRDIRANLGIISSCNTGNSYVIKGGEGLISIGRGFFSAGCPALILGMWQVRSNPVKYLVAGTCRNLISGEMTTAQALETAKLSYLSDKNIGSGEKAPYFWAGLTLWGKNAKLSFSR